MSERPSGSRSGGEPSSGWLLVRRLGRLWGVPHGSVRELTGGTPPHMELRSGKTLVADELLNLAVNLVTWPFPRCARPYYPEQVFGLAVWHEEPVILLEPGIPPACFRTDFDNWENGDHGD